MTTEANNNDTNSSETHDVGSPGKFPGCGPGCDCGVPPVNTKLKIFICLVVAVAVCGILFFKISSARQNTSDSAKGGFSNPSAKTGPVTNSASQQGGSGAVVPAINALNTVAGKLDTVFILIPNKDNAPPTKETGSVLAAVERTLNEKGLNTGIFTLQTDSPDYPDIVAKMSAPGIAVLTKGRGIGFVSGGISETNLMQAYVASTRGGGCGPKGCPPPADGSAAAPCN